MTVTAKMKSDIEELIDSLMALEAPGRGRRKLADMFLELPNREEWPDYYKARRVFWDDFSDIEVLG
jgi:chromatin structure-remodeling complex subunit RSC1/2